MAPVRVHLTALALTLASCVPTFPASYGLANLQADSSKWPGDALLHFISRPGNSPSACLAQHLERTDDALIDPFVRGLERDAITPDVWARCSITLLPTLPPASRQRFFNRLAPLTRERLEASDTARVIAVQRVLSARPREPSEDLERLRRDVTALPIKGASTRRALDALIRTLELDEGLLEGAPLTTDRLATLDDERLLRETEVRAPTAELRTAARRRVVRLHLAASSMREVKDRAEAAEAAVMATGRWRQALASLPPAVVQPPLTLRTALRASQDIDAQVARLSIDGEPPRIDLRPLVRFGVGWSEPLPLCAPPDALDVTPCIDAAEVKLGTGFATLDADGTLVLLERLAMTDLVALTRAGFGLVVPLLLAGRQVQVLQVPLTILEPPSSWFEGAAATRGPAVNVVVVPSTQGLLVEAVAEGGQRRRFVLPRGATAFEFGSRGGAGVMGRSGTPGFNGSTGSNGTSASCPGSPGGSGGRGGDGGPGGTGGPGGPGGDGGPVTVELVCGATCQDEPFVRAVFKSRGGLGGPGGPGGAGGRGGSGGSGGMGTSCYSNGRTTSVSGGSAGASGSNGPPGATGPRGPPGVDGDVSVVLR
ncbi:MAG: hypothetical protein SFW67_04860 [Myxococcaceae bacterium]|nr:hypothetical protein [Myxococcaceae bacterium]